MCDIRRFVHICNNFVYETLGAGISSYILRAPNIATSTIKASLIQGQKSLDFSFLYIKLTY